MNEREFTRSIRGAHMFRAMARDTLEADLWRGYAQGLRRHYHGEAFGTATQHKYWMDQVRSDHESRRALGRGYHLGFQATPVTSVLRTLARNRKEKEPLGDRYTTGA